MSRKAQLTIIALLVVIVCGLALFRHISQPKPNITIKLAPSGATMTLDGDKKIGPGNYHLSFGSHQLVATLDGFGTVTKSFYVKGEQLNTVLVLLNPTSAAGYQYLQDHPNEARLREQLGGETFSTTSTQVSQQNPIIQSLPYIAPDNTYRIDYGSGTAGADDLKQTVFITAVNTDAVGSATSWIQGKGYELGSLTIITRIEPMLIHIPHLAFDFNLTGSYVSGPNNQPILQLNALVRLSDTDQANRDAAIATYKQEVLDYISSCGADPAGYTINYTFEND